MYLRSHAFLLSNHLRLSRLHSISNMRSQNNENNWYVKGKADMVDAPSHSLLNRISCAKQIVILQACVWI